MNPTRQPAFSMSGDWSGQLVATAIHSGHEVRPGISSQMILDEHVRLREEDRSLT